MLKVTATDYIKAGEAFAAIKPVLDAPTDDWLAESAPLDFNQTRTVFENAASLEEHCEVLQLGVTAGLLKVLIDRFNVHKNKVPRKDAYIAIEGIIAAFKVELEQKLFFYVLPHRAAYYGGDGGSPDNSGREAASLLEAVEEFPEAHYDAREASTCFAFERFTASVYHLMRVTEHGLVSVAVAANVPADKHRSWDHMITGIHSHIKNLGSQKPATNWKEEEKKFSDLCSWFTTIRNGWRNPASHVPRIFEEPTVRGMFAATRTLFEHLKANGFKSPVMPKQPIALPGDDDE